MLATITHDTFLKENPYGSDNVAAGFLLYIEKDQKISYKSLALPSPSNNNHYELRGTSSRLQTCFVYKDHISFDQISSDKISKISDVGLDLIKEFEGCELISYICPSGVLTVGYGHTGSGCPPEAGIRITEQQAENLLKKDVERFEKAVFELVKSPINQNQFDALVSFAFNVGEGALEDSTLLRKLNSNRPIVEVSNEFLRWDKGPNGPIAGLTRRRIAERDLFTK